MFLVTILFIPIMGILIPGRPFLVAIGQSKEMAMYFEKYAFTFLPVAYLSCICDCQLRLLSNFGKTKISYICSAVGLVLHLIGCSLFVNKMGKGIYGTAVSGTFSYLIMFAIMTIYGAY